MARLRALLLLLVLDVFLIEHAWAAMVSSNAAVGVNYNQATGILSADTEASQAGLSRLLSQEVTAGLRDGVAAEITETVAAEGPAGEIAIGVAEAVEVDAAAAAIGACIASVVCGAVAAVAAIAVASKIMKDANGDPVVDPGQPQEAVPGGWWDGNDGHGNIAQFADAGAACDSDWTTINHTGLTLSVVYQDANDAECRGYNPDTGWGGTFFGTHFHPDVQNKCPKDANGNRPQPYYDGTCPSAAPSPDAPKGPAAIQEAVKKYIQASPSDAPGALKGVLQGGGPIETAGPDAYTGPAHQSGPATSTTVTNPDGTSTQTNTQHQYDYDYTDPSKGVQVHDTTHTTTTNKDASGNTTSSSDTTTTTGPGAGAGTGTGGTGGSSSSDPPPDLCALHPDVLACDKLGTPPTDGPTWSQKNVTFAPEDLGLPSGCPADRTFTVRGIVFALKYQPACDVAPMVAPALIAFTAVGVALWILTVLKGG